MEQDKTKNNFDNDKLYNKKINLDKYCARDFKRFTIWLDSAVVVDATPWFFVRN